jgi:hypothetical protein
MPTLPDVHMRGTRAAQPAATTVSVGALYHVTNEGRTERSNGSTWESWTDTAATLLAADSTAFEELEARVATLEETVQSLIDPTGRSAVPDPAQPAAPKKKPTRK